MSPEKLFLAWNMWLARNRAIFQNEPIHIENITTVQNYYNI